MNVPTRPKRLSAHYSPITLTYFTPPLPQAGQQAGAVTQERRYRFAAMVLQPSAMLRANRSGGGVGTSPGINPITPYTTAALDYRASWIGGEMRQKTMETTPALKSKLLSETINNEARGMANFGSNIAPKRRELPHPVEKQKYYESNGLERSLATNIPDHPTAIQVNGLRMERVEGVVCPGYVDGVGSYDARVLCGNWAEERSDKAYVPSIGKQSTGRNWMWETTYQALSKSVADRVRPAPVSNAETMYTDPKSHFGTGKREESASSNKEIVKLGGVPGVDYIPGDPRSASRPAGNYVNYQCGKQHLVSCFGGRELYLKPFETTTNESFSDPATKHVPISTERCDVAKPAFQVPRLAAPANPAPLTASPPPTPHAPLLPLPPSPKFNHLPRARPPR